MNPTTDVYELDPKLSLRLMNGRGSNSDGVLREDHIGICSVVHALPRVVLLTARSSLTIKSYLPASSWVWDPPGHLFFMLRHYIQSSCGCIDAFWGLNKWYYGEICKLVLQHGLFLLWAWMLWAWREWDALEILGEFSSFTLLANSPGGSE